MPEKRRPTLEPRDERVPVADGLSLRVLRWDQADGATAGVPFLLVHGLASNARLWDGVARRLAAAGHQAVAVDLRGHGRSDKPDDGYDLLTIPSDLRALIAALGLDRPILAGQSLGASMVSVAAAGAPDVVRGVVLVDGHMDDLADGFSSWEECWQRLAPPQLEGLPLSSIEASLRTSHPDWPAEGIAASLANFEVRSDGTIAPWLTRERHKQLLRAMWEHRVGEVWTRLAAPVLIVPVDTGDRGWTAAKTAGVAAAEAALRAADVPVRTVWLSGDHDVHAQHPAELAEIILEACRSGLFGPGAAGVAS